MQYRSYGKTENALIGTPCIEMLFEQVTRINIVPPPFEMPTKAFSSIKPFLTVNDMAMSREKAVKLGGQAFEGEWSNPVFKVSNIADRDGNYA